MKLSRIQRLIIFIASPLIAAFFSAVVFVGILIAILYGSVTNTLEIKTND